MLNNIDVNELTSGEEEENEENIISTSKKKDIKEKGENLISSFQKKEIKKEDENLEFPFKKNEIKKEDENLEFPFKKNETKIEKENFESSLQNKEIKNDDEITKSVFQKKEIKKEEENLRPTFQKQEIKKDNEISKSIFQKKDIKKDDEKIEYEDLTQYHNYTNKILEKFFDENSDSDAPNFFSDLALQIKNSESNLQKIIEKTAKKGDLNTKIINKKKEEYINKLDDIKSHHINFETKINSLNELYSDKLSYISLLSNSLFEFEKVNENLDFINKIVEYINDLNQEKGLEKVKIPKCLIDKDDILSEGIEIYLSFKDLLDTLKESNEYNNFISNFSEIEKKVKDSIIFSIQEYYNENNFEQLQKMMKVTEVIHNDFVIQLYIFFILNDIMKLEELIAKAKNINLNGESINEELIYSFFNVSDEFHINLIKYSNEQFGTEYSKIFLIFPETRQRIIITSMVKFSLEKLDSFRKLFTDDEGKSNETFIKMALYIYEKTIKFVKEYQEILSFSNCDLSSTLEQNTNIFLGEISSIYRTKDKMVINDFLESSYKSKIRKLVTVQDSYFTSIKGKKNKNNELNEFMKKLSNDTLSIIESTNFSVLLKKTKDSISKYNILIQNPNERKEEMFEFFKDLFDTITLLICEYAKGLKLIIEECSKKNFPIDETLFIIFSKIDYCKLQYKQIFLYDLREVFRNVDIYDEIEDNINSSIEKIDLESDNSFNEFSTLLSLEYEKKFNNIKIKEIYKISNEDNEVSKEFSLINLFLNKIFTAINYNFVGLPQYKRRLDILLTKITIVHMKEILQRANFTNEGVSLMKNDFQKIANLFAKFTEEVDYNLIYDVFFLSEILTTRKEELKNFIENIKNDRKYENDRGLINTLEKKRKNLKDD